MTLLLIFSLFLGFGIPNNAPVWGNTGHRATAAIAIDHLTPQAKSAIDDLLEGETAIFYSTYGDDIKSDSRYREYSVWHYVNIPEGKTYEDIKDDDLGPNIVTALAKIREELTSETTAREDKQFYLKMLIHLIGDLHQPMHVGRPDDRGGNGTTVNWFGRNSNLHRVWDSDMIDSFNMSYSELAANQKNLSKQEIDAIAAGNVLDWVNEATVIAGNIYDGVKSGDRLGYEYMYIWMPVVREQLQKGGIRLAKELNDIFG